MTSEAPERIWALADRRKQWSDTPPEEWSGHPTWHWSEYIRADLHQQALEAAREEGRRMGLEEAAAGLRDHAETARKKMVAEQDRGYGDSAYVWSSILSHLEMEVDRIRALSRAIAQKEAE